MTDSNGNTYHYPLGPIGTSSYLVYAEDTAPGDGGADTITVTLTGTTTGTLEVFAMDYAGIAASNALDVSDASSGMSTTANAALTTTFPVDLILAYVVTPGAATSNTPFTQRLICGGDLLEDETTGDAGVYVVTASLFGDDAGLPYTVLAAAFRARCAP